MPHVLKFTAAVVYFYSPETKSVVKLVTDVESRAGKQRFEMELDKYSVGK